MKKLCYFLIIPAISLFLTGCPPTLYCEIRNRGARQAHITLEHESGGGVGFVPQFTLKPGESRRIPIGGPHVVIVARDSQDRIIGRFNPSTVDQHSDYYNFHTYTYGVAIQARGLVPTRVDDSSQ